MRWRRWISILLSIALCICLIVSPVGNQRAEAVALTASAIAAIIVTIASSVGISIAWSGDAARIGEAMQSFGSKCMDNFTSNTKAVVNEWATLFSENWDQTVLMQQIGLDKAKWAQVASELQSLFGSGSITNEAGEVVIADGQLIACGSSQLMPPTEVWDYESGNYWLFRGPVSELSGSVETATRHLIKSVYYLGDGVPHYRLHAFDLYCQGDRVYCHFSRATVGTNWSGSPNFQDWYTRDMPISDYYAFGFMDYWGDFVSGWVVGFNYDKGIYTRVDEISVVSDDAYYLDHPICAPLVKAPAYTYDKVLDAWDAVAAEGTAAGEDLLNLPFSFPSDLTSWPIGADGTITLNPTDVLPKELADKIAQSKPNEGEGEAEGEIEVELPKEEQLILPQEITMKFPFCIPFDLYRGMQLLAAEPVEPVFRIPLKYGEILDEEVVLDFSKFSEIIAIVRWFELIIFCVGLASVTRSLIKW